MAGTPRKFRFGAQYTGSTLEDWLDFARKAEDLGFSTLVVQDHFAAQLSPLPALVAAASVTSKLRLAAIVLNNDFRHPANTAKEAATVDVLTGGRLELGMGAGWLLPDYQKTGISFDPPPERMSRFVEAVKIVKAFFAAETAVTFQGKHYQVEGLDAFPKATQKPRPPLMIGGRQKRMLSFAALEADIVSISMLDRRGPDLPKPPAFAEKIAWVRAAAGERYVAIEIHANSQNVHVTDNQRDAIEDVAARLRIPPEDVLQAPANLIGSVDAIVEQLYRWRESCDLTYFVLQKRAMDEFAPVIAKLAGA